MRKLLLNYPFVFVFLGVSYLVYSTFIQDYLLIYHTPELPNALEQVKCVEEPENDLHAQINRAFTKFNDYGVYSVCLPKDMSEDKSKLVCAKTQKSGFCQPGELFPKLFTRALNNDTFRGSHQDLADREARSDVRVIFNEDGYEPFRQLTDDSYLFTKHDVSSNRFKFIDDFTCETAATVRHHALCSGVLGFNSLTIAVHIEVLGITGTPFPREYMLDQVNHWVSLLNNIVQPLPNE